MNNDEFVYFFHGTTMSDPSLIDEMFNNGLISYRGNNMSSTMTKTNINNGELASKMKEYKNIQGGNAIFVIKIPKYYLTPKTSNGQLQQIPLPIWKKVSTSGEKGDVCQLSPELIYGVYLSQNDSFVHNSNYTPVHNPDGLQFDISQIDHLNNYADEKWIKFANDRNNYMYNELQQRDQEQQIWSNATMQYKQHFGIEQNKNHHSL